MNVIEHYEMYVRGEISKEAFQMVRDITNRSRADLMQTTKCQVVYKVQHAAFPKLLSRSQRYLPLNEMMGCVDKVAIDGGRQIVVY